jgi:hypothetical protein
MNKKVSITEQIKSFEDACRVLGLDPKNIPGVEHLPEKDRKSIVAFYKLTIIARALNEGWEPDFFDFGQRKYWNWFYADNGAGAGFVYANAYVVPSAANTNVGSRLCFKTSELAEFARENFRDLYFEYLFINMPKNYGK